ncbi:restriction endonuclease, partial [Turicibacter sanguinis]|nr:restriction endonuclease [Turicibacter sanguinis]
MSSKQFKESKIKFTVFFYLSILLSIFFLFQIRYTLNVSIKNWDLTQYTLLILVGCFLLICILRYHTVSL